MTKLLGLVGKKRGMTRVFQEDGESIPVTVIEIIDNSVTQIKTIENDGYNAIQVKFGLKKPNKVTKALLGIYKKAEVEPGEALVEYRLDDVSQFAVGQKIALEVFKEGEKIDVKGVSKGKGFQGGVKRWNFRTQDATHGNSLSHRAIGSTGQNQTPGRVFKGKKMPGQMGNKQLTQQSLLVVKIDTERSLILVKGAVPGPTGATVHLSPSVKSRKAA